MRAFLARLLSVLIALLLPAAALAQSDGQNPNGAAELEAAAPNDKAHIAVAPDGDDLRVTVTLDRPVDRFVFRRADVVREDSLQLETPGLTFADGTITADAPFHSFTYRLIEDVTERDAKYPAYYRVGEGYLLYARTVYPDPALWDTTLEIAEMPDGWMRWPLAPLPDGYLFIGPEAMVMEEGGARFIVDGNSDERLDAEIRNTVVRSLAFLTETFGSPPANAPFVATSILPSERRFSTGDVTADAMVALRFFGTAPDPAEPASLASIRLIILHEGVHFWNGGIARFAPGTPQWLHEGGAEYIATLASWRLGWSGREDVKANVSEWLDRCRTSLSYSDEVALNELDFINSSLRYSCGPMLHFLSELYLADGGSSLTVMAGWRETVRYAVAENNGEYDIPAFLAALDAPGLLESPALAAILATSGRERWQVVTAELRRLGVGVEERSSSPLRARTALMHLIRGQCTQLKEGESYGFYSGESSYRLDTPAGCGMLAGGPEIARLAGHPVAALTAEDYTHLQALCTIKDPIAFGLTDGSAIDVPCLTPLPDAATQTVITELPEIAAFRKLDG